VRHGENKGRMAKKDRKEELCDSEIQIGKH